MPKWSELIPSDTLQVFICEALANNQSLKQQALDVQIARTAVFQSKMQLIPTLDGTFAASRQHTSQSDGDNTSDSFSVSADLSYDVDLWGKMNDEKKSALFSYAAAQADYQYALRSTVSDVAEAWASIVESQQLANLRQARLVSLQNNLKIIEDGYHAGINTALEVYLARSDVESERAQHSEAQQKLSDDKRSLNVLLGTYPGTPRVADANFPNLGQAFPSELPSELLKQRIDLQAAWLRLLALNADLAVAHKARFPSIKLNSSAGYNADTLSDLGQGGLAWSLTGAVLQPILSSGSLKAAEKRARYALEQGEQAYIATVYSAFQEVESELENQQRLAVQYHATERSRNNAIQAEKLSFEQYRKGIVSYTTVLDAQRRALDAEIQHITLNKQIFVNKIKLHEVLSGEFDFITSNNLEGL